MSETSEYTGPERRAKPRNLQPTHVCSALDLHYSLQRMVLAHLGLLEAAVAEDRRGHNALEARVTSLDEKMDSRLAKFVGEIVHHNSTAYSSLMKVVQHVHDRLDHVDGCIDNLRKSSDKIEDQGARVVSHLESEQGTTERSSTRLFSRLMAIEAILKKKADE